MDCSIFSLDCPIRRRYAPYPFDFSSNELKEANLTELEQIFETSQPVTIPERTMNQPQPTSKEDEKHCLKYARDTLFNIQLDQMLKKLSRTANSTLVAYTISDIGYAKEMIHDVFAMAHNVVGFPNSFFMVAIDEATLELGCRYGYPILPSPRTGGLEDRVKFTKFQVSLDLLKRGQNFLFFEMDVWFFQSMLPLLQQFGDLLVSSHQNSPTAMNIGVYAVNSNDATREYFQHCLDVASKVEVHDQKLMQQLETVSGLQKIGQDVPRNYPNVTFEHHIQIAFLNSHEIACSEWPRATVETIAIHPLSTRPLMGPHGKMQIAKELGAYYGSHGYYSSERRYLWLDRLENSYTLAMDIHRNGGRGIWHDGQAMKWTMATLIAIAKRTNRIWVLPRIQADIGGHLLWQILDLRAVEELGVEVRETSFLNNPKLAEFSSVSRTAVGAGKIFWQDDENEEQKVWRVQEHDQIDKWFSLLDRIKSKALLVNPHAVDSNWPDHLSRKDTNRGVELTRADNYILDVYNKLKWCNFDCPEKQGHFCQNNWGSLFWEQHQLVSARASRDCYGNGS